MNSKTDAPAFILFALLCLGAYLLYRSLSNVLYSATTPFTTAANSVEDGLNTFGAEASNVSNYLTGTADPFAAAGTVGASYLTDGFSNLGSLFGNAFGSATNTDSTSTSTSDPYGNALSDWFAGVDPSNPSDSFSANGTTYSVPSLYTSPTNQLNDYYSNVGLGDTPLIADPTTNVNITPITSLGTGPGTGDFDEGDSED